MLGKSNVILKSSKQITTKIESVLHGVVSILSNISWDFHHQRPIISEILCTDKLTNAGENITSLPKAYLLSEGNYVTHVKLKPVQKEGQRSIGSCTKRDNTRVTSVHERTQLHKRWH